MTYTITNNTTFNSIEISFSEKPSEAVREALKALRFRWHKVKGVWYGYATEQEAKDAIDGAEGGEVAKVPEQVKKNSRKKSLAPLWDRCDVSSLPKYGTENELKQKARDAAHANGSGYDKEAAKIIRAELKERFPEMKISVTSGGAGWLNSVNIRIKAGPYCKIEKVVDVCGAPETRKVPGDELQAVLDFCNKLHDAFDADDGDYYADYGAHHDLYGHACVEFGYEQTKPTPEQVADCEAFQASKAAAEKAEEERQAAEMAAREEQHKRDAIEAEKREQEIKKQVAAIAEDVTIEDLPEEQQFIIHGLRGGIGKENNLQEVLETMEEYADSAEQKAKDFRKMGRNQAGI